MEKEGKRFWFVIAVSEPTGEGGRTRLMNEVEPD